MLTQLSISNFAIIEKQHISFKPGLNVISGETGAGKSIVLHALELILGAKPRPHVLRAGAESAQVEALFDLSQLPEKTFAELPEAIRAKELIVSREISENGRSKIYINGRLGSVGFLQEVLSGFVSICGQNQHVRLLESKYHREVLDYFAKTEGLVARYSDEFRAWRQGAKELEEFEQRRQKNGERRSELESTLEELSAIQLRPGIRRQLEDELKRHANAENILTKLTEVEAALSSDEGLSVALERVAIAIRALERVDPSTSKIAELFNSGRAECDAFEEQIRKYGSSISVDEEELSTLRDDLAEVARLERKYRTNDLGLCELLEKSKADLKLLNDDGSDIEALRASVTAKEKATRALAEELTRKREKAGKELARLVQSELADLSMSGARLELELKSREPGPDGADDIQFLIAPNRGEPPRALRDIASGGELSRIMLVLKKVLREKSSVNVLVFDEVDSGISGGVARAVGEKLKQLSSGSQVICITHLAQVASLADAHLLVEKSEVSSGKAKEKRTVSIVRELTTDERVEEVARMIAGHKVTKAARESARELMGV